ncbi:MAG TPA: adenylate/guanylate cyclase domain-containing protein [Alphaproteobacteria bacterium]
MLNRVGVGLLLVLLGVLRIWDPAPVQYLRVKVFDLYQTLRPSRNTARPVVIVDIDEESLKAHGQWPWPRTLVARLIDRLADAGAVAVGFDIIFAEPDGRSPSAYAEAMPELPEAARRALTALPSNDSRLAASFGRVPVVVAMALLRQLRGAGATPVKAASIATRGPDPRPYLVGASAVLANVPELQRAARGAGLITHYPEFDGVVRRVPALYRVGPAIYPTMAIELIRIAAGGRTLVVRTGEDGVETVVVGGPDGSSIAVPTDRRGRLWVHASRHDPKRYASAGDVLSGAVGKERLEGRLVIVGTSAVGLLDIKSTPVERAMPGVEVHAQLIENILYKDHISRPFYADAIEFFTALALSIVLIAILPALGAIRTLITGFALVGIAVAVAWLAYAGRGLLFDLSFPLAASFMVYFALTFLNYLREERQRRWVRNAFTRYLSPEVVTELAKDPARLNLGGEMREMTLLFSDIRGFTGIAEGLDAAQLTQFMNRYLTPMTDAIMAEKGTVDKYMGDAIMAFWNAPLDDVEHAGHACRAALAMQGRLAALNAALGAEAAAAGKTFAPVVNGIGLNTAVCCVGNMGSQQRFDYSVLGDGVNLASRLEGQTKSYGVPILVGEETQAKAADFATLEVDLIRVKGKHAPARIFALLGGPEAAQTEAHRALATAQQAFLAAYRAARWDEAGRALARVRAAGGERLAALCDLFAARLAEFRQHPPPPAWDGVFTAETK